MARGKKGGVCVCVCRGKGSDGRRQSWLEERRRNFRKLFAESIKRGKKHHAPHTVPKEEEQRESGQEDVLVLLTFEFGTSGIQADCRR